jgi:hypothetical protein
MNKRNVGACKVCKKENSVVRVEWMSSYYDPWVVPIDIGSPSASHHKKEFYCEVCGVMYKFFPKPEPETVIDQAKTTFDKVSKEFKENIDKIKETEEFKKLQKAVADLFKNLKK